MFRRLPVRSAEKITRDNFNQNTARYTFPFFSPDCEPCLKVAVSNISDTPLPGGIQLYSVTPVDASQVYLYPEFNQHEVTFEVPVHTTPTDVSPNSETEFDAKKKPAAEKQRGCKEMMDLRAQHCNIIYADCKFRQAVCRTAACSMYKRVVPATVQRNAAVSR